ncbi:MAG: hypothetical protein HYX66_09145 [Ignavibacteria bacterium]|nr:hypothetical protein [Ignavibacteria bacterium]
MFKQAIIIVVIICAAAISAVSQNYLSGTRLRLVDDGQTFGGVLIPPTPTTADVLFLLPSVGGQFLVDDGSGKSAWLVGGQAVTSTSLIGSTTAFNVQLVAGPTSTVRAEINASSKVVALPDQTELRFYEPSASGTNYSAVKAADTQSGNITLFLPATVGPAGAWLGVAAAPAPTATTATLTWITPP